MPYRSGRHFLQIPGPTNVPDRRRNATELFQTLSHQLEEPRAQRPAENEQGFANHG